MDTSQPDSRIVEFEGKYEIVTPDELLERLDEELLELIVKRGEMDEATARKTLAHLRRGRLVERVEYDRA